MAITCPPKVITDRVVLCRRPTHPLGKWVLWSHQVLRVYWVPPGESRTVLGGLLGVSILISMLVMFMFWHTSPVCRQQDACNDLCSDSQKCGTSVSTYSNMSVNLLHRNDSSSFDAWPSCLQSAQDWQKKPGNPLTQLACYFPNSKDQATIACIVPLQGDACTQEKKYRQMLTGASSALILITFFLVPRTLEFIFSLIFGICCQSVFVKSQGKTIKGVSLSVIILIALGVLVLLLVMRGGTGFIGLRITVWLVTWLGSMIIVEPIVGLLSYYLIRCKRPEDMQAHDDEEAATEEKPLLSKSSESTNSSSPSSGLFGHTGMAAESSPIEPSSATDLDDSLPAHDEGDI